MKKTITKKTSSPKKSTVAEKASVTKKVSAPKKVVAKATFPVSQKTSPVPKKVSSSLKKTSPVSEKSTPVVKKTVTKKPVKSMPKMGEKVITKVPEKVQAYGVKTEKNLGGKEGVKILGILHLVGNILSGGTLGIILVTAYLLIKKDTLTTAEKETCYEIINFNLSFIIYMGISVVLIGILIGLILVPIVALTWLILLILGFLSHLVGENYKYPCIIRFIS